MATEAEVLDALRAIEDPDLHRDIVALGFIKKLAVCNGIVSFQIEMTTPACPVKEDFKRQAQALVSALPEVTQVKVEMTANTSGMLASRPVAGVGHVISIGAGKGGVGKSTVAVNLAISLANLGARVGLMDADVYGPNTPTMLGPREPAGVTAEKKILPAEAFGIRFVSMGFFVPREEAVVWRGPMLHGAVRQFLQDVVWGDLDYLIVDLPPGTGDVALSLAQMIPMAGAVIVSTPQEVSIEDCVKAAGMFKKVRVDVLGMIENMSGLVCPHCAGHIAPFGEGSIEPVANRLGVPYLGAIPMDLRIREAGDAARPLAATAPKDDPIRRVFEEIAGRLAREVSTRAYAAKEAEPVVAS